MAAMVKLSYFGVSNLTQHTHTHIGVPPWYSVGISEGCFMFDFITFGGRSAHLAYHAHKSVRKTTIVTIIIILIYTLCF